MRIIKHYSNRKLYDTQDSRDVTLQSVAALVRQGEEIQVIDRSRQQDITTAILAQIIFEDEKRSPHLPVAGLQKTIQTGKIL